MISVENLNKSFDGHPVLKDLSFEVHRGEVLGFLGPNGAGKSTTMRILTGFLEPSSGSVKVGGIDVQQSPLLAKAMIGYLPESSALYQEMKVHSFLKFIAEIRGIAPSQQASCIERVVSLCHLEKVLYQSIETLSKGFKQRTGLAQALIHDPDVLILDEPTDGLDPNQKHEIRQLISRMGQDKAIIFSTHILEEVEAVCTRAIIINHGEIVANSSPSELKSMSPTGRLDDFFRSITQSDTSTDTGIKA
jgi:ABC-2 type transport system ATP-binding protein